MSPGALSYLVSGARSRAAQIAVLVGLLALAGAAAFALTQWPLAGLLQEDPREALGSVTIDGHARPYLFHVPPDLDDSGGVGLVMLLHGAGTGANAIRTQTGFDAVAEQDGVIAVYPNAAYPEGLTSHAWNAGFCCDAAWATGVDDLGYLSAILDQFERAYEVDPDRVYLVGISSGAMMAHAMAAHHPDRIAAIAALSGAVGASPGPGQAIQFIPQPQERVSVLMLHGDHDRIIPFEGGATSQASGQEFPSFSEGVGLWADYNGLTNMTEYEDPVGSVTWRHYSDGGGVAVVGATIHDAGHGLNTKLPVGEWMWEFLKEHPKPA